MTAQGRLVALLGAESTGKSTLAHALAQHLRALPGQSDRVALVPEVLREFCLARGRLPSAAEQPAIAAEQSARIAQARAAHDWVIADTTALQTAAYSEALLGDASLTAESLAREAASGHLTLLMGLDLPWVADGWLRDGPAAQAAVDDRLRSILNAGGLPFATVYGHGEARTASAWRCLMRRWPQAGLPPRPGAPSADDEGTPLQRRWRRQCLDCLVPDCEHLAQADPGLRGEAPAV